MSLRRPSRYRGGQKVNDANIEINALLETQPFDDKPSSTGEVQFDEDGLTVVHRAIENGNYNLLILSLFKAKTIEERKKLVNAKTQKHLNADRPKGLTPFHMAAYARGKNHSMEETLYKMLIELQKHKGKIDELNSSGLSPLHYAAYRNSVLAVRVLTRCGCDLNAVNQEGRTPLMIACIRKAKEVITLLLNKRETLDFERKDRFGNTFLHLMAQYCDEDLINTFLDIDEILRIDDGRFFERINRVQKLINLPSQERRMTPLRIVVERGFLTALQRMRFLLRWVPAEPEKVERSQQKKNKEEERERIEKAKNETIKNNTDILHIAASIGNGSTNLLIVQELIKFGFPIEAENDDGQIPLHIAAKYNNYRIVEELLTEHHKKHMERISSKRDQLYKKDIKRCVQKIKDNKSGYWQNLLTLVDEEEEEKEGNHETESFSKGTDNIQIVFDRERRQFVTVHLDIKNGDPIIEIYDPVQESNGETLSLQFLSYIYSFYSSISFPKGIVSFRRVFGFTQQRIIMSSGPLAFGIFLDLLFNKDISKARYNVVELQRLIVWIKESDDLEFEMLQSYQYRSDQENQNLSNAAYECPIEELEELQNGKDEKSLAKSIIAPQPLSVWRLSDQNERISDESLLRIPGVLLDPEEIVVEKDKRASSIIELQEHSFSPIWRTSDQGDGRRFFSSTLSQQTTIDSGMIEEPEDIIEIMDSKERSKSIDKRDINGMTPLLHTAFTGAWEAAQALIKRSTALKPSELFFDENNAGENMIIVAAGNNHPEYLDKLFEELSKRQLLDKRFWSRSASSQTTPLHCVAENGSLKGTMKLIEEHARIDSLNSHNQTLLHVAAKGGHLPVVEYILRLPDIVSIINYKDYRWNTPLHLAAQFGFEEIIQALLRKGADPKIRNFYRKTAFDVAVVKGHLECVKILLKYFKIDGENDRIKAPIHYAAKHGHDNVVQYLLRHGAQIDILVNMESGESDETALTIALDFGRRNVAKKLLTKTNELDPLKSRSWESLLFHKKKRTEKDQDPYDTPMRRLIKDFPDLAELVMDQCICESDGIITYNFEFIDDPFLMQLKDENGNETGEYRVFDERGRRAIMENGDVRREATLYSKNGSQIYKEHPIMLMAKSDNPETKKLLEHRLVVKFIDYRWSNLGRFVSFWLSLLPYAIFLILYTIILLNRVKVEELEVDDSVNATNESIINLTTFIDHNLATIPSETQRNINDLDLMSSNGTVWSTNLILSVIAFVFWCYLLIKEIFQCYSFGSKAYFSSGENIIELTVYGLSLTTIILKARIDNDPKNNDSQAFWIFASIVVVLSWLNLLMLISKWKTFGIFVRMFKKVAVTVLSFALMFFFFIMAFSFSFILLLGDKEEFSHIGLSFLKTFVMSTGEMEYSTVFLGEQNEEKKWLRRGALCIFAIFIFVMVILVMNLLTGLAVDDIQEIQNSAKIEGIAIEADSVLLTQTVLKEKSLKRLKYKLVESTTRNQSFDKLILKKIKAIWASISFSVILCWLSVCSCFCNNDESEIDEEEQNEIETEKAQNEKQAKVEMSFIDERFAQESLASLSTEKLLALNQQSIYALQKEVKNLNTKLKDQEEEHHVKESKLVEKLDRISEMLEEMKNGKEFGSDKMQTGNQMETMKTLETMNNEDVHIEDDGKDSSSTEAEWSDELMDPPAVNFTETEEQEESDNEACASLATMPQFPLPNNHKRKLSTTRWALLESSPNDPADWKAQRFSDT